MYLFFNDFDAAKSVIASKISNMLSLGCFADVYVSEVEIGKGPHKCNWVDVTDEISVHVDCLKYREYFSLREQIDDNDTVIFSSSLSRFRTKCESSKFYVNFEPIENEQDYIEINDTQSTFSLCDQVVHANSTLVVT